MPGRSLDTIGQCEAKRSFRELREDIVLMTYAAFLSELVSELWPDRSPEPSAYDVLLGAWSLLSERNPRLVSLAGAWQLLALAGFHPEYERCVTCGQVLALPAFLMPVQEVEYARFVSIQGCNRWMMRCAASLTSC